MKKILFAVALILGAFSFAEDNRVVLITGASRGVGLSTAQLLSENGFRVYATTRTPENVAHFEKENLHFIYTDLKSESSILSSVQQIIQKEGHIDILINNAGYALVGAVESLTSGQIQDQLEVNFLAPIRLIQSIAPFMRKNRSGHIINISSTNAQNTPSYGSLYAASKAALESLSESLRVELDPFNIKVSIIEPGTLSTHFFILLGQREVADKPYLEITSIIEKMIEEREANADHLPLSQSKEEVAQFILEVINSPHPKLRYQTSKEAEMDVSKKIHDLNGDLFLQDNLQNSNL